MGRVRAASMGTPWAAVAIPSDVAKVIYLQAGRDGTLEEQECRLVRRLMAPTQPEVSIPGRFLGAPEGPTRAFAARPVESGEKPGAVTVYLLRDTIQHVGPSKRFIHDPGGGGTLAGVLTC